MNKRSFLRVKMLALSLLVGLASILGWFGIAQTQAVTNKVDKDKIVDSALYSAGEEIVINGTINGDVHCAGKQVIITGTVNGDVLCVSQTLVIKGSITGSVRAAAQDMKIEGSVGRSVSLAAEKLHITKQATIGQDATIASTEARLDGTIGRDAVMSGGVVGIDGGIGRNIVYKGSELEILQQGKVAGTVRYESSKSIRIADGASVGGSVTRDKQENRKSPINAVVFGIIITGAYIFALLLVLVWPQTVHAVSDVAVRSIGKTLLVGLAASMIIPLMIGCVAMTLVGIPVAIFLGLAWIGIAMLSGPIAAYYLGSMILARSKNAIVIMIVGSTVLLFAYSIPVVGTLAAMFAYFIGSGALLITLRRRISKPDYKVV